MKRKMIVWMLMCCILFSLNSISVADEDDRTQQKGTNSNDIEEFLDMDNEQVEANGDFTLVLKEDGSVWSLGDNSNGQLGDGTTKARKKLKKIEGLTDIVLISTGTAHAFALKNDGSVYAWGQNTYGQLGDGTKDWNGIYVAALSDDDYLRNSLLKISNVTELEVPITTMDAEIYLVVSGMSSMPLTVSFEED